MDTKRLSETIKRLAEPVSRRVGRRFSNRAANSASLDVALLATASNFDLTNPDDRQRSVKELEGLFFRSLRRSSVKYFIEAGANDAEVSVDVRTYCEKLKIIAFEANPYVYEEHAGSPLLVASDIDYRNRAVSNQIGKTTFEVLKSRKDGLNKVSSLLKRTDGGDDEYEQMTVDTVTLDSVWQGLHCAEWAVWVDVEGAQESVLTGADESIGSAQMVFIEVEDRERWDGQWLGHDVEAFLADKGFVPIARDFQATFQYNVLYWRRDLMKSSAHRRLLAEYYSRIGSGRG